MAEEGTELERVPLAKGTAKSDDHSHQSSIPEIVVLDEDSRPSTSGKSVPAVNWGDKKVSPNDLEVRLYGPLLCTPSWPLHAPLMATKEQRRRESSIESNILHAKHACKLHLCPTSCQRHKISTLRGGPVHKLFSWQSRTYMSSAQRAACAVSSRDADLRPVCLSIGDRART